MNLALIAEFDWWDGVHLVLWRIQESHEPRLGCTPVGSLKDWARGLRNDRYVINRSYLKHFLANNNAVVKVGKAHGSCMVW